MPSWRSRDSAVPAGRRRAAARDKRHRFLAEVIAHAVRRFLRFSLSLTDVQERLAVRGGAVANETIGQWCRTCGSAFATAPPPAHPPVPARGYPEQGRKRCTHR
jgi:transposase-like protein